MSLILEALRKSEAERRRRQAPGLHTEVSSTPTPVLRLSTASPWAWLLAGAIVGALLLGTLWLTRVAGPARIATPVSSTSTQATTTGAGATLPAVPRLLPPAAATGSRRVAAPVTPPSAAVITTQPITQTAAAPAPVIAATAPVPVAGNDGATMQLSDLSAAERKSLPPLKMSMHLWDNDPTRRFVIIDGNRLVEGDRIGDAVVTAITSDGVLLDWNGRRLKLPIR